MRHHHHAHPYRHAHPHHHAPAARGRPNRALERWLVEPARSLHGVPQIAHHVLVVAERVAEVGAVVALASVVGVWLLRRVQARQLAREARLITIGVPPEVQESGGLLLWQALHDLLRPRFARLFAGQPHLSWEIAASEAGTTFRLWVPKAIPPGLIERAVSSAWPGASATIQAERARGDDPLLAGPAPVQPERAGMVRVTSELVLAGPDWFPLQSAMSPDPLPLILGQLSGFTGGEEALVQVVARPATSREQHRLRMAARRIRAGVPTSRLVRAAELLRTRPAAAPRLDPTVNPDVRAVMQKSTAELYRCLIRVSVSADSRDEARGRIHAVLGGFAAYNGPRVRLRRRPVRGAHAKLSERRLGHRAFLLSTPELAAIAHLPTSEAIPGVVMAGAREVAPPPGLPQEGKPLGLSANGRPVNLAVADARQHIHVMGPTGVGKSTLIANLVLADFDARRGAVVIDPKGDLIEDLLARIPEGRENDVDLLDPLDASPPGLNVLDSPDRDLGVDQLVGIFRRVFERYWGPRTDDILRAALLTLTAPAVEPTATLVDVPRLLAERDWRAQVLRNVDDPVGLGPFWAWYDGLSEPLQAQVTGPLLNKLRAFLLRAPVRAIVGQRQSTLDVAGAIDRGRLVLAKLSKGMLGEDTSRLLGSFIVARVWQAALARAQEVPEDRRDASLYVDEVHNYLNLPTPFEDIAAEARGYRLSLCLAHQHLAQLPRDLREALGANARSKVYFQLSRDDAGHLERETRPELTAHDLAHLPAYTAAVRLCHDGQPSSAFTLETRPLPAPIEGQAHNARKIARERQGTTREQTEHELAASYEQAKELEREQRAPSLAAQAPPGPDPLCDPVGDPISDPASDPIRRDHPRELETPANHRNPDPSRRGDKVGS
jgi:hypothetical protein